MKRPAFPIAIASVSDAYDKMVSFDEAEFNDAIAELMAQFEVDEADDDDADSDDDADPDPAADPDQADADPAGDPDPADPDTASADLDRVPVLATVAAISAPAPIESPVLTAPREKSLLQYIGVSLSASILLLVLALAAVVIAIPALVGGMALTVLTQSMEPGFPPGTLVVIKPTPVSDIRIGDVLTYQIKSGDPAVVSHRVVSKSVGSDGQTSFMTKGDNNDVTDPNVVREIQIKGTLWYSIPLLGHLNTAINGEARAVVIPVAASILFLYATWMVIGSIRDRRKKYIAVGRLAHV